MDERSIRDDGTEGQLTFCDLHIHSKYSRATSARMDIDSIVHFAQLKGLNLMGTGDFTHPRWMNSLKNSLSKIADADLYRPKAHPQAQTCFMVTCEISTVFRADNTTKKIHHLVLTPTLETAEQITDRLRMYGDLSSDGRPTLHVSPSEFVETIMQVSKDNVVIPAHVWTPWYSLFGSKNGFDRIEDCYEDTTRYIFALETGLSSDPPMNWRLSALDRYTLISNSDAHSPYPYRVGREANVFQIDELSYSAVLDVLRKKDPTRLRFTIETDPGYGKYHWTGHRNCGVSMPHRESRRLGGQCPVCRRPMTKGVDERTTSLADRPDGVKPRDAIDYIHLLPLQEVIAAILGVNSPSSPSVWQHFTSLVTAFGNEYAVLLDTPFEKLQTVVEPHIAATIIKVRNDAITVKPGYDGVYGEINLSEPAKERKARYGKQDTLERYV